MKTIRSFQVTVPAATAFSREAATPDVWHAGFCHCPICDKETHVWAPRPQGLAWSEAGCDHCEGAAAGFAGEITVKFRGALAAILLALVSSCGQQPAAATDAQALVPQARTQQVETTQAPAGETPVVTSETLPPGDTCPAGGMLVTVNGQATVICNGVDGAAGQAGRDGVDGQNGQNGADGSPGTPGEGFPTFQVLDAAGAEIGSLVWVNPANSDYWVISGDMRLQFARTTGHFPNAYMFCSLPACAGTCKVAITNGVFGNVFEVYDTGALVQATGRAQAATFSYQSRRMGSSCTNSTGSTSGLYDFTTPTLDFAYPVNAAEVLNQSM
jgi:hypothetical protein